MVDITKKAFENNDIEVIIEGVNKLWLNETHIEKKLIKYKQIWQKIFKKHRYELADEPID